jgi:hypothetical protein
MRTVVCAGSLFPGPVAQFALFGIKPQIEQP